MWLPRNNWELVLKRFISSNIAGRPSAIIIQVQKGNVTSFSTHKLGRAGTLGPCLGKGCSKKHLRSLLHLRFYHSILFVQSTNMYSGHRTKSETEGRGQNKEGIIPSKCGTVEGYNADGIEAES